MKVQEFKYRKKSGEITAFLTMVFLLFVSLVGGLMEAASIQIAKNDRRVDMNCAIESVFAEYQRDLLEEFKIFALEGSYETGVYSENRFLHRLEYYGAAGIENQVAAIRFLTDPNILREQIQFYIEGKYGKDWLTGIGAKMESWTEESQEISDIQDYANKQAQSLESLLSEEELQLMDQDNSLSKIKAIQNRPLLQLVIPEGRELSSNRIILSETPSYRNRREGYGSFSYSRKRESLSAVAFGEYVLQHFQSASKVMQARNEETPEGLQYELEYIIAGMKSDNENIGKVIEKLLLTRMVSNYTYISRDAVKRTEAETMAFALTSFVLAPEASEIVTHILLLAWAFGESIIDMRTLLAGKRVPVQKSADTWQLSLAALLTLGTSEDAVEGNDIEQGLSYEEYLRILLFAEEKISGKEKITLRVLDMIEQKIRIKKGCEWFRIDNCISKLEINSICNLRRGISYRYKTYFGYH